MPYIICVNQPGCLPESDPTAVATIEEARDAAFSVMAEVPSYPLPEAARLSDAIHELPESGGTVGPLPDGYVIDVQRVTPNAMRALIGPHAHYMTPWELMQAYNNRGS